MNITQIEFSGAEIIITTCICGNLLITLYLLIVSLNFYSIDKLNYFFSEP